MRDFFAVFVDARRSRSGPVAAKKLRGNLLAAVLLLTSVPKDLKISQEAVEHCCLLISNLMLEVDGEVRRSFCTRRDALSTSRRRSIVLD